MSPMKDGGMGSLRILKGMADTGNRRFKTQISDCMFKDCDGVEVVASLNIDENGELFELDIWKVDFSPLIDIPSKDKLK